MFKKEFNNFSFIIDNIINYVTSFLPMAVQYHYHVTPYISHDQYTALPLVGVLFT